VGPVDLRLLADERLDAQERLASRGGPDAGDVLAQRPNAPVEPAGAEHARRAGVTVWVAGPPLVAALRHAAGITRRGARPSAAMLARLPAIPWLRSLLRRLEPPDDGRQIPIL
jgi:hypothetical protein